MSALPRGHASIELSRLHPAWFSAIIFLSDSVVQSYLSYEGMSVKEYAGFKCISLDRSI
jgi:hypothetical protein